MSSAKSYNMATPIGVLGYGKEGASTLNWLLNQGIAPEQIAVFDQNPVSVPNGVRSYCGTAYLQQLKICKTIIRSAGVPPFLPALEQFRAQGGVVTSQIALFLEIFGTKNVVGITGTMGKGSCLSMISHILTQQQVPHQLGGNFGIPALDLLPQLSAEMIVLLELSSFQLMDLTVSPEIAVLLQTTVDHLDWHRSLEEYHQAKANLVRYQSNTDLCVVWNDGVSAQLAATSPGVVQLFGHGGRGAYLAATLSDDDLQVENARLSLQDCRVVGAHQLQNMAAATLVAQRLGIAPERSCASLKSFMGLDFRLQKVGQCQGISYFNDSYATRPDATVAAVRAMEQTFGIILGGSDKGADFTLVAQSLQQSPQVRAIALIGSNAEQIAQALAAQDFSGSVHKCATLEQAFAWLRSQVSAPGAILLSPASASFGLFKNYVERGQAFNKLVNDICQSP